MEGGLEQLSWVARGMAAPRGPTRQPSGVVRQGKKVADGRCGRTIEAQPVSGQTCLIEPQRGWPGARGGRNELAHVSVFGTDGIAGATADANRYQDAPLPVKVASMKPSTPNSDDRGDNQSSP